MQITVIIPSYKSSQTLHRCLESVVNQRTQWHFDVIVVHSGSEPISDEVRSNFSSITFFSSEERWFPGRARNFAVRKTNATWILFLDADCIAEPDWLECMVSKAINYQAIGVGGGISNATPWYIASWVMHLLEFGEWLPRGILKSCENFPSCNAIYKRSALLEVDGFPEDIFPCEDTILNYILRDNGHNLLFCPDCCVRHIHGKTVKEILLHNYAHGATYGRACRHYELPGRFLLELNAIAILPAIVSIRFARTALRLIPKHIVLLPVFLLTSPLVLLSLIKWGIGFVEAGKN